MNKERNHFKKKDAGSFDGITEGKVNVCSFVVKRGIVPYQIYEIIKCCRRGEEKTREITRKGRKEEGIGKNENNTGKSRISTVIVLLVKETVR